MISGIRDFFIDTVFFEKRCKEVIFLPVLNNFLGEGDEGRQVS